MGEKVSKLKLLFLDVDGVLNNRQYITDHRTDPYPLDLQKVSLINQIKQKTGCRIVISSSWRYSGEALDALKKSGIDYWTITSNKLSAFRGDEIQKFLKNTEIGVSKYAILDDDSDFYQSQEKNLFQTSFQEGLTDKIAQKVIAHLGEIK